MDKTSTINVLTEDVTNTIIKTVIRAGIITTILLIKKLNDNKNLNILKQTNASFYNEYISIVNDSNQLHNSLKDYKKKLLSKNQIVGTIKKIKSKALILLTKLNKISHTQNLKSIITNLKNIINICSAFENKVAKIGGI
jgi:hypothetical protein